MSLHMRLAGAGSPLSDASSYVLGMPHLSPNGLSENWLWKELGHRHWNLIAKAYGRAATGFGSVGDSPFTQRSETSRCMVATLAAFERTTAWMYARRLRISRRPGSSVATSPRVGTGLIADVEMTSVFVRRQAEGVNRSITRVRIEGTGSAEPSLEPCHRSQRIVVMRRWPRCVGR